MALLHEKLQREKQKKVLSQHRHQKNAKQSDIPWQYAAFQWLWHQ
jgi:hypothetical protein